MTVAPHRAALDLAVTVRTHFRYLFHGEAFDVVKDDGLALNRLESRQGACRAPRPAPLLFPRRAVLSDRLVPSIERFLDRYPCAPRTPQVGAVPRQEDREGSGRPEEDC